MKRQKYAILSALFVLGLTAGLIVLADWLAGVKSQPMRPLTILTRGSVTGLVTGAPVLYRGIAAGHVTHIGFDPKNLNLIEIGVAIRKDTPLVPGTRAELALGLLSSSAMIALTPPVQALHGPYQLPHPYPRTLWMTPAPESTLLASGAISAQNLVVVTRRLEKLLSPANERAIQESLANLNRSLALVVRIEHHLGETARSLPGTERALNHLMDSAQTLVRNSQAIPKAVRRTLGETGALERTLAIGTLPKLNRTLDELSGMASHLSALSRTLEQNPQAWHLGHRSEPRGPHPGASAHRH